MPDPGRPPSSPLRVLMLGWEFPPFITGGLGTACHGLTKALNEDGVEVLFVLPKAIDPSHASHVRIVAPGKIAKKASAAAPERVRMVFDPATGLPEPIDSFIERRVLGRPLAAATAADGKVAATTFLPIEGDYPLPYATTMPGEAAAVPATTRAVLERIREEGGITVERLKALAAAGAFGARAVGEVEAAVLAALPESNGHAPPPESLMPDYDGDLVAASHRYAQFAAEACRGLDFDVIHAHDWLTYPAGIALQRLTGKPLVVHVHSTEFDRSGEHPNQGVYNIERRGMWAADRIIAVSLLTKNVCVNRYGIAADKVDVVYNGVDLQPGKIGIQPIHTRDKIVLYFGRITMQKGPEYFVQAAKRVLEVRDDVKFVVAGSGDQAARMIQMAADLGIGDRMLFTGFLRGKDISRVFAMADLYVMPSVSEPFGIAPLEAMGHNVPVLISKSSGVSEILSHALKVDFWDIEDMADKILAVLRHSPLARALREGGAFEVRGISWDGAARKCERTYRAAIGQRSRR